MDLSCVIVKGVKYAGEIKELILSVEALPDGVVVNTDRHDPRLQFDVEFAQRRGNVDKSHIILTNRYSSEQQRVSLRFNPPQGATNIVSEADPKVYGHKTLNFDYAGMHYTLRDITPKSELKH